MKAGGGCGSCLANIEDTILAVQQERDAIPSKVAAEIAISQVETSQANASQSQRPLTTVQKITLIQTVLDQEVRPVLLADGGDVELYDVDGDRVQVILQGACGSCSSSTETLKYAIEARLQERILPSLVVEAV